MTVRQKILKLVYPLIIRTNKRTKMNTAVLKNAGKINPNQSIYDIPFMLNNGSITNLSAYKGKKIMLVNTASNCGYTHQYEGLEKLCEAHKNDLVLIAFPSNNFKQQEKGNDEEIAKFCQTNYGITFPLAKKSVVIKEGSQNKIFKWLTHDEENGWLNQQPTWNFCKYLINETGMLTHFFEAGIEPMGEEIATALKS
ncbi:MAG: glutathione peroxidase [Bacteroidetes bacterium]|nr:glutathione peroxidase [Bacteroidota bacterium]